ncbi:MAG TPA: hypothetical protein VF172_01005 [Nitrososphaera sp.]
MNRTRKFAVAGITVAAVVGTLLILPQVFVENVVISGQVESIPTEGLAKRADLVIIGTVTDKRTETTESTKYPLVNIATIEVVEPLKNGADSKTIEVRSFGTGEATINGIRYNVKVADGSSDLPTGKDMVLFLDYDEGNVLGDGYYVIGGYQGVFTIEDGMAENADSSRDLPMSELRTIIEESS